MKPVISYRIATGNADFKNGRILFEEYAASLSFSLCFQNFAEELETLHKMYAMPEGALWLAENEYIPVGCAGIRKLTLNIAELKRLYVQPDFRGYKVGVELLKRAIDTARTLGYEKLRLDTLNDMTKAVELYHSFGFYDIEAYRPNPHGGLYMELAL